MASNEGVNIYNINTNIDNYDYNNTFIEMVFW